MQHFILTRFNLRLWTRDKEGHPVRTREWLTHRFMIFERYCLPSIMGQTCKEFEWILLFDDKTPEDLRNKIVTYQRECSQFIPIFVESSKGRYFAQIFRTEVFKRLRSKDVLTTYLDNDDSLHSRFVEDLQKRASTLTDGTFITYTDGFQFYTDYKYLMKIHYPRNHFVSVIERREPASMKTIYGYGSHYYIDRITDVKIERISDTPMWCEIIHEKNMGNDAYFLKGTKMINDSGILHREFALDEIVNSGIILYVSRFIPRYMKTFIRRTKYRLFGRQW